MPCPVQEFVGPVGKLEAADGPKICRRQGGDGVKLDKEADLPAAVAEGLRKGGLYLIDVRVSPTTTSNPHGKVYYGIPSKAPLLRPLA